MCVSVCVCFSMLRLSLSVWNQEPNDYAGFEDCAVITKTGEYNDLSCNTHAAVICELSQSSKTVCMCFFYFY